MPLPIIIYTSTIGAIIEPNDVLNLNQSLLGGVIVLNDVKANNKNIIAITNDKIRKFSELTNR